MASKKVRETKQAELTISKSEAQFKLQERVVKGRTIQNSKIQSQQVLDETRKEYYKWDEYNTELLKRIFTTDEFANQYSQRVSVYFIEDKSLTKEIHEFQEDIDRNIRMLDSIIERLELIPLTTEIENNMPSTLTQKTRPRRPKIIKKVFIVHGRDDLAKTETARFIEKLGFEAIILHEQASSGKTIIEKIEKYTDVEFGIVLYTPCDVGSLAGESNQKPRARQNVVFEHGYLIAKLGRHNVCALVKVDVERPADIDGVVYILLDDHGAWQMAIVKELRSAGYEVDTSKIF